MKAALATVAVALLPLAPAHAGESAAYSVTPKCSIAAAVPTGHDTFTYVVTGTAVAKSTVGAVPVSTTIHCVLRAPYGEVYWEGTLATPGAVSAIGGTGNGFYEIEVCGSASATFSDGVTISTAPC
jgi:hypothetical protein